MELDQPQAIDSLDVEMGGPEMSENVNLPAASSSPAAVGPPAAVSLTPAVEDPAAVSLLTAIGSPAADFSSAAVGSPLQSPVVVASSIDVEMRIPDLIGNVNMPAAESLLDPIDVSTDRAEIGGKTIGDEEMGKPFFISISLYSNPCL